jgi:type I restriction enzyme S subunit
MLDAAENTVFSGFVLRARPKGDDLVDRYKACAFRPEAVRNQIIAKATYTTRALTNGGALSAIYLAKPTKPEQSAIAEALSDMDEAIAAQEAVIAKKRALRAAIVATQFDIDGQRGHASIPSPGHVQLRTVLEQSATYGIVKAGNFQKSGVRMLRGGDIKGGQIVGDPPFVTDKKSDEFSRTILQKDDVVIALVGYPGEAAVVPDWMIGGNISRAVGLLRPNDLITSEYLTCYLNSSAGRAAFLKPSAGSAQIVVNLSDLNQLNIPLPSIQIQIEIAKVISVNGGAKVGHSAA